MPTLVSERTSCRVCGGAFEPLLDLGMLVVPGYVQDHEPDPARAPLDLVVCQACSLVQLRHSVERDHLYRQYWYQSAINESMVSELRDVAACAVTVMGTSGRQQTVLDVGANDGTFLRVLAEQTPNHLIRIALEPSETFADTLCQHANMVITEYFPHRCLQGLADQSIHLLTSIAMFYDVDDPVAFVAEVDRLLTPDGVWIVQMQDLAQMVKATAYDNVCFEHLAYYSTATFRRLLAQADLDIQGVETRRINGGSLRYYITRRSHQRRWSLGRSVEDQLAAEAWLTRSRLELFAQDVVRHKSELRAALDQYSTVDLYAASTKSSTLLQYCGIDHTRIRCAVERSPQKVGLVTTGTRIPIVSEDTWRRDPAPVTLLSAWGFRDAVVRREAAYLENGGRFLIPLPHVEMVERTWSARSA